MGLLESKVYVEKKILVLSTDVKCCEELAELLASQQYSTASIRGLSELEKTLDKKSYPAVVLDIDTIPLDNRVIRKLTKKYPAVRFLGTSKDRLHPELQEAIRNHIYACLTKPVDPDEIFYLLRSIYEDDASPKR